MEHGADPGRHLRDCEPDLDRRPADQKVFDGIVQEIDIRTGQVLFQWSSADHVPYRDSHNPRPASAAIPWDWFHINAVHLDTDGNLLINSRYTWTTYKVNRHTGKIIWELGGKQSTFRFRAAPGKSSTARARSSRSSTTQGPSEMASTHSSTMSPTVPPRCCPAAGSSR